MADCLVCRIVAGEIPATIVKRSDDAVAFRDIEPEVLQPSRLAEVCAEIEHTRGSRRRVRD